MNPNVPNETASKLAKANINFTLKLWELINSQNMQLMQNMQRNLSGCHQEVEANARKALQANDWMSINMGWMSMPLIIMKMQSWQTQQLVEFSNRIQQQANAMVREAMLAWQKDAAEVMQESMNALPIQLGMRNWLGAVSPSAASGAATTSVASAPHSGNSESASPSQTSSLSKPPGSAAWMSEPSSSMHSGI